ncbi:hypothetical protein LTR50_002554 [Elasticomyces elasticus]|nr:hypothetical protein LTR50_002554 [Elasticomyces elasticus]
MAEHNSLPEKEDVEESPTPSGRLQAASDSPTEGDLEQILEPSDKAAPGNSEYIKQSTLETVGTRPPVLTRTITGRSNASSRRDPGPPPDGGLLAWTQAVMAHLVIFSTWGYISSFGLFQSYYEAALGVPPSNISWVGSVQVFLLFFIGTFSGRALDAGFFHPVFISGVILQLLGVFMTSLATKYWQLFLAQGICNGIGGGLMFCPTMSLLSTYFLRNRSMAIGIAASGTATGGLVFPAIARQLLPRVGFSWTVRVMGFVMLAINSLTISLLRTRLSPRKTGPIVEWTAFKELTYSLYCLGMFLNFWGLYFAYYYVASFGRDIIGISSDDSMSLLLVMNGIGVLGRLVPGYFSDHTTGPLNMIIPFTFCSGIVLYAWSGVTTRSGLFAFAAFYGLISAGVQGMFPAALSSLTTDMKKAGVRMGMGFSIVSFACLTGPPLAGALIQYGEGRYLYAQMFAGSTLVCGGLTLVAARIAKTGWNWKRRI